MNVGAVFNMLLIMDDIDCDHPSIISCRVSKPTTLVTFLILTSIIYQMTDCRKPKQIKKFIAFMNHVKLQEKKEFFLKTKERER